MDVGTEVWVQCDASVWAPGVVLDCQEMHATGVVKVKRADSGALVTRRYLGDGDDANEIFLRNSRRDFASLSCLIGLEYLHEPALLHALSERFAHDRIYTSIGDILLAVNPFKELALYSDAVIDQYKAAMVASVGGASSLADAAPLPPHVFAIAGKAFSGLLKRESKNQSILVSGESGSGKTESTKFLMKFLTLVGHDFSSAAAAAAEFVAPGSSTSSPSSSFNEDDDEIDDDDAQATAGDILEIGKRILQTNPILESFGNAQTIRNDNSSRFGKFIKIQFDAQNQIVGAEIASYLLEKVRLIHQSPQERNFHIFYELLEGADAELLASLGLERGAKYELLNAYGSSAGGRAASINAKRRSPLQAQYSKRFRQTVQAFEDTGVEQAEREQIFCILAALLHLGNVNFASQPSHNTSSSGSGTPEEAAGVTDAKSAFHLDKCAELLGVDVAKLKLLLLTREITAGNDVVTLKLNAEQSKDASRSFAKAIYGRLFTWLVSRLSDGINYRECLAPHEQDQIKTIGILDIFGFEDLASNGFEQLCINYANERLQAQFNEFVFIKEQDIYVSQGLDWRSISYPSNAACLALFDDKSNGLFSLLDQECLMPKGSNQALSTKFYRYHGGANDLTDTFLNPQVSQKYTLPLLVTSFGRYLHQSSSTSDDEAKTKASNAPFTASKMDRVNQQFVIKHFAGKVRYGIDQFLEKNQDALPTDACRVLTTSENDVVSVIGADEGLEDAPDSTSSRGRARSRSRGSLLRAPSVSFQFRGQLDLLIDEIGHTEAHYIRCLKPNEEKKSGAFDRHRMVEQLRSVGVLEALRIARAGYSARLSHDTFVDMFACYRYKLETSGYATQNMDRPELCKALLALLLDEASLGKSDKPPMKTLLKVDNAKFNDAVRGFGVQLGTSIVFCKTTAYNEFIRLRLRVRDHAARVLQRIAVGYHHYQRFQRMKKAVVKIQVNVRRYQATKFVGRLKALRQRVAAYCIQRQTRVMLVQQRAMDAKIQTHRLRRTLLNFQRGCAISKKQAEEAAARAEEEAVAEALALERRRSSRRLRSGSEDEDDHHHHHDSASDKENEKVHVARSISRSKALERGHSDAAVKKSSSQRGRTSSEEPEDEDNEEGGAALRNEIERLQKLLGEQQTRAVSERKLRTGGRSRVSSLDVSQTAATARRLRTRRTMSVDKSEADDEMTNTEDNTRSHPAPRRSKSVMHVRDSSGGASDHVSKLTRRIEELDAKCRQLERLVSRPYDDRYPATTRGHSASVGGFGWDARRRSYSYANSDGSNGAYSDYGGEQPGSGGGGGSATSGVENLIWSIQQQMDMLRHSVAYKNEEEAATAAAMQARHDAHTMSFASSQPTRSSTVTSNGSSTHQPFDGPLHEDAETDGYPGLPSPSRTNSDLQVGGYGFGRHGAMTPPTPASEASFHMGAAPRHPSYPFAPPRVVKWSRNTHCHECEEPFTLFTRRHHCRMCGNSFCHEHSSRRVALLGMGFDDEPQRVCDACFVEYQAQASASPDYYSSAVPTPLSARSAAPGAYGAPMYRQRSFSQQYYPPPPPHPSHQHHYASHPHHAPPPLPPQRYHPTPYYGAMGLPPAPPQIPSTPRTSAA